MDKQEFLISLTEKIYEIYDEIINSEVLEPEEIDIIIQQVRTLCDQLEGLIE